jgi:acylphosphatase
MTPRHERRRLVYRGRVQGVGFRATSAGLARSSGVTGYVRNQPDGTVELVAEGTAEQIESLLTRIDREFADYIEGQSSQRLEPAGAFDRFEIRY